MRRGKCGRGGMKRGGMKRGGKNGFGAKRGGMEQGERMRNGRKRAGTKRGEKQKRKKVETKRDELGKRDEQGDLVLQRGPGEMEQCDSEKEEYFALLKQQEDVLQIKLEQNLAIYPFPLVVLPKVIWLVVESLDAADTFAPRVPEMVGGKREMAVERERMEDVGAD